MPNDKIKDPFGFSTEKDFTEEVTTTTEAKKDVSDPFGFAVSEEAAKKKITPSQPEVKDVEVGAEEVDTLVTEPTEDYKFTGGIDEQSAANIAGFTANDYEALAASRIDQAQGEISTDIPYEPGTISEAQLQQLAEEEQRPAPKLYNFDKMRSNLDTQLDNAFQQRDSIDSELRRYRGIAGASQKLKDKIFLSDEEKARYADDYTSSMQKVRELEKQSEAISNNTNLLTEAKDLLNKAEKYRDLGDNESLKSFWEGLKLPLLKDWATMGATEIARNIDVSEISRKIEKEGIDSLTDEELQYMGAYTIMNDISEGKDIPLSTEVGNVLSEMIPFAVQMAYTGGVGAGAKGMTYAALRKSIPKGTSRILARGVSATARLPFMPMTYKAISERRAMGEDTGEAILKGVGTAFSEVFTEELGAEIQRGAKKILPKIFKSKAKLPKVIEKIKKDIAYDGPVYELIEEEINIPIQAAITGDRDVSELWDSREQATILLSTMVAGAAFKALEAPGAIKGILSKEDSDKIKSEYNDLVSDDVKSKVDEAIDVNDPEATVDNINELTDGLPEDQADAVEKFALVAFNEEAEEEAQEREKEPVEEPEIEEPEVEPEKPIEDAERIRTETEERGPEEALVEGEEERVRVRGDEKDRVEAEPREEVTPEEPTVTTETPEKPIETTVEAEKPKAEEALEPTEKVPVEAPKEPVDVSMDKTPKAKDVPTEGMVKTQGPIKPQRTDKGVIYHDSALGTRVLLSKDKFSERFLNDVEEKGIEYAVKTHKETQAYAEAITGSMSPENAYEILTEEKYSGKIPSDVKYTASVITMSNLDKLSNKYRELGDEVKAKEYDDMTDKMYDFVDQSLRDSGRQISMAGSQFIQQYLTPRAAARQAKKQTDARRDEIIGGRKNKKKFEATKKAVFDTDSVVDEVIGDKKAFEDTKKRARADKAKIKKIQDKRSALKDKLKSTKGKTLQATVIPGLDVERMEIVGEIVATYVEEFGENIKPIIKNIKSDLNEIGVKLTDKQALDLLPKEIGGKNKYSKYFDEKKIKSALASSATAIDSEIREHFKKEGHTPEMLAEKLSQDLDISMDVANDISNRVYDEFKVKAKKKIRKDIDNIIGKSKELSEKDYNVEIDKLVDMASEGAFREDEFRDAFAKIRGIKTFTEQDAKNIEDLSRKVSEAKTETDKVDATIKLMDYQANMEGVDWGQVAQAVWYGNVLSGYTTQALNITANLFNLMSEAVRSASMGRGLSFARNSFYGFQKGLIDAAYVFKTGQSPLMAKLEAPRELMKLGKKNPLYYYDYIFRFMAAADMIFYDANKYARAFEMERMAANQDRTFNPKKALEAQRQLRQILGLSKENLSEIDEQVKLEGRKGLEAKRRKYELIESKWKQHTVEESDSFGAKATFNYKPEGFMGLVASTAQKISESVKVKYRNSKGKEITFYPGKLVIPFTRVIANVANTALEYTPIGAMRALKGSYLIANKKFNREFGLNERYEMAVRSAMGIVFASTLFALSNPGDDDEPLLEITAKGTGNYKKNYQLNKADGWQEYSIGYVDDNGDKKWISYKYTPGFLVLGGIGAIRDGQKYGELSDDDTVTLMEHWGPALISGLSSITDMTALSGMKNMFEMMSGEGNYGKLISVDKIMSKALRGMLSYIPGNLNLIRQFESDFIRPDQIKADDLKTQIATGLPFGRTWTGSREEGNVYVRDMFGEKAKPKSRFGEVFWATDKEADPVAKYLIDNNIFITEPSKKRTSFIVESNQGLLQGYAMQDGKVNDRTLWDKFIEVRQKTIRKFAEEAKSMGLKGEELRDYMTDAKKQANDEAKFQVYLLSEKKKVNLKK